MTADEMSEFVRAATHKRRDEKKSAALGMSFTGARNRLIKTILFDLVCATGRDSCFRCGLKIDDIDELSIEHKEAWLESIDPVGLFFDLRNISFSHLLCNAKAGKRSGAYTNTDELIYLRQLRSVERTSLNPKKSDEREFRRVYHLGRYRRRREEMIQALGGACRECGGTESLQIRYRVGAPKSIDLSKSWGSPWSAILEELKQCELMCTGHRTRAARRESAK